MHAIFSNKRIFLERFNKGLFLFYDPLAITELQKIGRRFDIIIILLGTCFIIALKLSS